MPARTSGSDADVLTTRELNRALLARQMLVWRHEGISAADAIERLVGMQAQAPEPPYYGLWTRLAGFDATELSSLVERREVVRVALMRSTIHLVTARDCLRLRPAVQPVIDRGMRGATGRRLDGLDLAAVERATRALLEERALSFGEIGELLRERYFPHADADALGHAARTLVPLVQVPPRGLWRRSGAAVHRTAESWLGRPLEEAAPLDDVVLRYLAAFGPATVKDVQAWCGLTRLAPVLEQLRPRLRSFRDERGRELFDLPDAPRPDPDDPAPPRFLPEFDNVLLSHDERTRIIAREHYPRVFRNGMIASTVLVDGFVAGVWRVERGRRAASLHVTLWARVPKATREAIAAEGERLLAFAAAEASEREVRIAVG